MTNLSVSLLLLGSVTLSIYPHVQIGVCRFWQLAQGFTTLKNPMLLEVLLHQSLVKCWNVYLQCIQATTHPNLTGTPHLKLSLPLKPCQPAMPYPLTSHTYFQSSLQRRLLGS